MITKIKNWIITLSREKPSRYTGCYLISFVLMLISGVFFVPGLKAVAYPVFFEKQEMEGIIEEKIEKKVKVHVSNHGKKQEIYEYTFIIDGEEVPVYGKECRQYDEGDFYKYNVYRLGGIEINDPKEYNPGKGLILTLYNILIFCISGAFFLTDVNKDDLKNKEKMQQIEERGLPKKIRYEKYSTNELYEMCRKNHIKVMKGKRKNRKYLIGCLARWNEHQIYCYNDVKNERKMQKKFRWVYWLIILSFVWLISENVKYISYIVFDTLNISI